MLGESSGHDAAGEIEGWSRQKQEHSEREETQEKFGAPNCDWLQIGFWAGAILGFGNERQRSPTSSRWQAVPDQ